MISDDDILALMQQFRTAKARMVQLRKRYEGLVVARDQAHREYCEASATSDKLERDFNSLLARSAEEHVQQLLAEADVRPEPGRPVRLREEKCEKKKR